MPPEHPEQPRAQPVSFSDRGPRRFLLAAIAFLCIAAASMSAYAATPPAGFAAGQTFHVEGNSSLGAVAGALYAGHFIRSEPLFKALVVIFGGQRGVKAGDYYFSAPQSLPRVAWRMVRGSEEQVPIKVTIPEGSTARQISAILGKAIPGFATSTFLSLATPSEGYLFPDTYFFNKTTSPASAISAMRLLFDQKISTVQSQVAAFAREEEDVIIMASILEKEASSSVDRRIISGILWKRLDAGQPLEVDATLAYGLNKAGTKLTTADLATPSPFNTYKSQGLPPAPISNPGLPAILDAVNPTVTPNWYYISDKHGAIHYAKTYDEQLANENKYL